MKPPLVSLILPFFNAEKYLKRALTSIQKQSLKNFECIMINNNSTDQSVNIAQEFAFSDPRFILTNEEKQGVIYASNKGSSMAKAAFVARMDSDDECMPDRLKLQCEFLQKNPDYGAVSGLVEYVAHNDNSQGFAEYVDWLNSMIDYENIFKNRFIESPIANPSAMWRKEVGEQCGMYRSGDFPEDYEMWLRWLYHGVKIGKVEEIILRWQDSDNRLTRSDELYSINSFYKAKSPYLAKSLAEINPLHPKVSIWGASKIARKRASLLQKHGVEIDCFIDISKKRQINEKLLHYTEIPPQGEMFILVYVKQREMREEVVKYLKSRNYVELQDFILVS